jgi:dihydropteroate synthase
MERVHAAVGEGADIVEIAGGEEIVPFVAAVREAYPELVIAVRGEVFLEARADLVSGPGSWAAEVAAATGAGVVVPLAQAPLAVEMGVAAERIVVSAGSVTEVAGLVATGWPVLVRIADGDLATAAVAGWLGARVFRVDRVRPVRRALRMVAAIRGDIPPARAVRGLALSRLDGRPDSGLDSRLGISIYFGADRGFVAACATGKG